MRWIFLRMWWDMLCVSYSLVVIVFSVFGVCVEEIGPTSARPALELFAMCALVSAWMTFLRGKVRVNLWRRCLLGYAGCAGIVLTMGNSTGFIPLEKATLSLFGSVLFIITAVFLGTALFSVWQEKVETAQINRRLQQLRGKKAGEDPR